MNTCVQKSGSLEPRDREKKQALIIEVTTKQKSKLI